MDACNQPPFPTVSLPLLLPQTEFNHGLPWECERLREYMTLGGVRGGEGEGRLLNSSDKLGYVYNENGLKRTKQRKECGMKCEIYLKTISSCFCINAPWLKVEAKTLP